MLVVAATWLVACGSDQSAASGPLSAAASTGRQVAQENACGQCHSTSGARGLGPTWRRLAGSTVQLRDGSTVTATTAYLRRSIEKPDAQVVAGFNPVMPTFHLSPAELTDIVAYIEALG